MSGTRDGDRFRGDRLISRVVGTGTPGLTLTGSHPQRLVKGVEVGNHHASLSSATGAEDLMHPRPGPPHPAMN